MAILDGLPRDAGEARQTVLLASGLFERELGRRDPSPRLRSVVDLLREGLSFADIYEITAEERDAVLLTACRQLQSGNAEGAKPLLTQLVMLEPTDERAIYALATAHQALGEAVVAGKLYLHAIALDATNPEGYLRLGECFLADREVEGARGCFEAAKVLAAGGPKAAEQTAYADKMLAALPLPAA